MTTNSAYLEKDRAHLIHPLHRPDGHSAPLLIESGHGVWLHTVDGREIIDGLAGLWNVLVGHGNKELAEAARAQMESIAYSSNYIGTSTLPTIELADRLAGMAYPNLNRTFFAAGGAESNESAFKTVRYYWKRMGKPDKVKVISRIRGYHGVTLAAMSATGISSYWPMFEPRVPNFLHIIPPYPYRFDGEIQAGETMGLAAARALEEAILREGADTVAAFIGEPVIGAGGVIVPPDDYWPRIREICDQYDVLLIADEVITGFGRTGEAFALNRYGIQPDIMSFAKGVTSGYLPLGGIQISDQIADAIDSAPADQTWMHAYTYSGHPTCCAVALKNLEILEREQLTANAGAMGARLLAGLEALSEHPNVDDARGLGLMCAIEFVKNKESREPAGAAAQIRAKCMEKGLLTRVVGDIMVFAPPLIISAAEIDQMLAIVEEAVEEVLG